MASVGGSISIVVGRNGLGWGIGLIATDDAQVRSGSDPVKREGDGKSPAGVFALGTAFGYASDPLQGLKVPYLNLTPSIECVDDPGSKHYNRIVDRSVVAPTGTAQSTCEMRRGVPLGSRHRSQWHRYGRH